MNDQVIKSIADWFSVPVVLVFIVLAAAAIWWIWARTGKLSIVFNRLLRLIAGDISNKDSALGKATEQHLNLMYFRLMFFPSVRTNTEALKVIAYTETNDEEIGDVAACGRYFDVAKLCVRTDQLPQFNGLTVRILIIAAFWFVACVAGILILPNKALIQYKPTGQYFWLAQDNARAFSGDMQIDVEECTAKTAAGDARDPAMRAAICELLQTPKELEKHLKTVPLQRAMLSIILGGTFLPGIAFFRELREAVNARQLQKRQEKRRTESQAEQLAADETTAGA